MSDDSFRYWSNLIPWPYDSRDALVCFDPEGSNARPKVALRRKKKKTAVKKSMFLWCSPDTSPDTEQGSSRCRDKEPNWFLTQFCNHTTQSTVSSSAPPQSWYYSPDQMHGPEPGFEALRLLMFSREQNKDVIAARRLDWGWRYSALPSAEWRWIIKQDKEEESHKTEGGRNKKYITPPKVNKSSLFSRSSSQEGRRCTNICICGILLTRWSDCNELSNVLTLANVYNVSLARDLVWNVWRNRTFIWRRNRKTERWLCI